MLGIKGRVRYLEVVYVCVCFSLGIILLFNLAIAIYIYIYALYIYKTYRLLYKFAKLIEDSKQEKYDKYVYLGIRFLKISWFIQ